MVNNRKKLIIRDARKEWICFDCQEKIDIQESHYEIPSIKDYNSTKDNRKSSLKLCKDCGNLWLKRKWNNFSQIPNEKKMEKLLGKNQSSKLLKELKEEVKSKG